MDEIAADPQVGLDATFALVPDLAQDPELQRQILDATIATWGETPYGAIDRDGWQQSLDFMGTLGLVPNPVTVDQLVDDSLLGLLTRPPPDRPSWPFARGRGRVCSAHRPADRPGRRAV